MTLDPKGRFHKAKRLKELETMKLEIRVYVFMSKTMKNFCVYHIYLYFCSHISNLGIVNHDETLSREVARFP